MVLVEGQSKRKPPEGSGLISLTGRTDTNKRCHFHVQEDGNGTVLQSGDYVDVRVLEASANSLFCKVE